MKKHYQRPLLTWITILIGVISLLFMGSCAGKKPVKETTTSIENSAVSHEVAVHETKSLPVYDIVYIPVPTVRTIKPECDSLCQLALEEFAARLQYQKQSGDNSYKILYDRYNKQLQINLEMGETMTRLKEENSKQNFEKYQATEVEKQVPYVPAFWRYSACLGWAFVLYILYRLNLWIRGKLFTSLV